MENNDDDLKVPGPVEWNFCVQVYSWQQGERGLQLICVVLSTLNYSYSFSCQVTRQSSAPRIQTTESALKSIEHASSSTKSIK